MTAISEAANAAGTLLGVCVWLHSCSQTAGISLGTLPLAKQVLSSSRLSLTHTASPAGWDIPACRQHCTICCTIFCFSRAHYCWASIFRDRVGPTAWPHTGTNLGWPEPQSLCPQQALNPASYCTPTYLLLITCFFQNWDHLLIFEYKECSCS